MKTITHIPCALILTLALLVLAGCSGDSLLGTEAQPSKAVINESTVAKQAHKLASLPTGTYGIIVTPADFPPDSPPEIVALLAGQWEIEFGEAGRFYTRKDDELVVEGRYISNPARLVTHDQAGPLACPPGKEAHAVYRWAFDNDELTLTAVRDACEGRPFILTLRPWQKQ